MINIGDTIIIKKIPKKYINILYKGMIGIIIDIKYGNYITSFDTVKNENSHKGLFYTDRNEGHIEKFYLKCNNISGNINQETFKRECDCVWMSGKKEKMEEKTMDNILEREMNIFNKGKEIIDRYKFYVREYYNQKCNDEIDELVKKSKVKEIVDKHKKQIVEEVNKLLSNERKNGEEIFIHYNDNSFDNFIYFTEEEQKLEKEIKNKYNHISDDVIKNIDRIKSSIDLCENREQVMDILRETGFTYNNGIVKPYDEILGEWK